MHEQVNDAFGLRRMMYPLAVRRSTALHKRRERHRTQAETGTRQKLSPVNHKVHRRVIASSRFRIVCATTVHAARWLMSGEGLLSRRPFSEAVSATWCSAGSPHTSRADS